MTDVSRTAPSSSPVTTGEAAALTSGASAGRVIPPPSAEAQSAELAELRRLLVGSEQARLDAIEERLKDPVTPDTIASRLPEAITLRGTQDRALAQALAPSIDSAIGESVRRRPNEFADAIFPVLGPAIRKAIAGTLNELVASINQAVQHSFSLRGLAWRVESWRTGVPYAQVVIRHALVYRVEQVFLIHRDTGLLLEQAHLPNLALPDADLVSGMLTAIRDFVADSFQQDRESGGLRSFNVGELSVIVEPGPHALLAAVVRGQAPPDYARRLEETIESVHAQFGSALADFEGDTAPFSATRPLLDDCLLSVLETDRKAGTQVAWKPWALAIGLILLASLAWRIWTTVQWRRGVRALAAAPGLVVIDDGSGWRSAHVRGLRDPDAPDPSTVLAGAGLDTTRVTQAWEPYLSMRPSLVLRRIRRGFGAGAPADSQLAMRGDTLVVRGAVQAEWLARVLRDGAGRVPGVAAVLRRDVTLALPAALDATLDSLAEANVLFAPGESGLTAGATESVQRVAGLLQRLDAGLAPLAARATVRLVGRADPVGRDSTNRALSRERAEGILRTLTAALGANRAAVVLTATGVGTTDPLATPDSTARARINRSVSFVVRVTPDSAAGASRP